MPEDSSRWWQVARRYAGLRELTGGMTPQQRGQQFNEVIAELLAAFGIPASANQRNVGEIDVVFSHAGKRYILEAKWEQRKTDTGAIAKLQRRVEQRMSGVTGILLAMKGYTDEALDEIDKGRRLDVLLLDGGHWDAMISGVVPPPEMLDLVTDAASFQGRAYTPLIDLVGHGTKQPQLTFGTTAGWENLVLPGDRKVQTDLVLSGLAAHHADLTVQPAGKLLLSLDQGVWAVDPSQQHVRQISPISNCAHAVELPEGSVLASRAYGVGSYHEGVFTPLTDSAGEPLAGQLLVGVDGSVWCLRADTPGIIELLKLTPDKHEQWKTIQAPVGAVTAAAWLTTSALVVAGLSEVVTVSINGAARQRIHMAGFQPLGLVGVNSTMFAAVDGRGRIQLTDIRTAQHLLLGQLRETTCWGMGVAPDGRHLYLGVRYQNSGGQNAIAVVQVAIPNRPHSPIANLMPTGSASASVSATTITAVPATEPLPHIDVEIDAPVPVPAAAGTPEQRNKDHSRGRRDGQTIAARLPIEGFVGLVSVNFDLTRWLESLRGAWERAASDQAFVGTTVPPWLPPIAWYLGQYVAPAYTLEGQFKPSAAYVIGFGEGLRTAWDSAVRDGLVPGNADETRIWLQDSDGSGRAQRTIPELRSAAWKTRGKVAVRSMGRILLWAATAFAGIIEIGAIGASATGRLGGVGSIVGANVFFALVFLVFLFFAASGPRRIHDHRYRNITEKTPASALRDERWPYDL